MPDSEGDRVRKRPARPPELTDRRAQRTKHALVSAFVSLFFEAPYDRITVGAIARRAEVSRSTFYEHYVDKEDLLSASLRTPLTGLAASVDEGGDARLVRRALEHFWQNRAQARRLLAGGSRRAIARVLAGMVEERLASAAPRVSARTRRVVAVAVAEAQLGTIAAWLRGETGAGVTEVADVIHVLCRGGVRAALGA